MNSWTVAFWWHQLWHTLHPISSALICSQLSANYNSSCSVQVPLWWGHLPQLFFSSRVPALFQFFSPLYLESLPPASLSSPVPFTLYLSLPLPRCLSLSLLSRSLAGFLSDSHQRSSCADSLITGEISERSSTKLQTPMTASLVPITTLWEIHPTQRVLGHVHTCTYARTQRGCLRAKI